MDKDRNKNAGNQLCQGWRWLSSCTHFTRCTQGGCGCRAVPNDRLLSTGVWMTPEVTPSCGCLCCCVWKLCCFLKIKLLFLGFPNLQLWTCDFCSSFVNLFLCYLNWPCLLGGSEDVCVCVCVYIQHVWGWEWRLMQPGHVLFLAFPFWDPP